MRVERGKEERAEKKPAAFPSMRPRERNMPRLEEAKKRTIIVSCGREEGEEQVMR